MQRSLQCSQVALVVKNLSANAVDVRDVDSISGSRRSTEVCNGNPLQHPCLENPIDMGAWRATVHRVTKSRTQLKRLSNGSILYTQFYILLFPLSNVT